MSITVISISNPIYSKPDNSAIDCTIHCEEFGVIPYTATASDVMEYGRLLYGDIVAGKHGAIAPYIAP